MPDNYLYYGDNLDILRRYIRDETVDLVYLDPPFNSNASYNVLFAEKSGEASAAQIHAFEDTWHWDQAAARTYDDVVLAGGGVSQAMQAFRQFLGENDMLAYLGMMAPRLVELRRVLKPTGSIYLHCDPTASHYLKMLMDSIFGARNFQNEIIWYYKGAGISPRRWGRRHDTLLWYSKTDDYYFDPDPVRDEYAETTKERFSHYIGNVRGGSDFGPQELNPKGKHPDDVWQLPILAPSSRARLGYPTQKPEPLLERIILSSSREGDVVLDPFCGCGTTIAVAQRLSRHWSGIDITHLAIGLMKNRLADAFDDRVSYTVIGEPVDLRGAQALAAQDKYQFQWWALGLVGARPMEEKKGADKGIDGRIYFQDDASRETKQVILSVKGGGLKADDIRALGHVVTRENAQMGVLITLQEPTQPMRTDAASGGFYQSPSYSRYQRLQILTVKDLLDGKRIDMPPLRQTSVTFRRAPKAKAEIVARLRSIWDDGTGVDEDEPSDLDFADDAEDVEE